MNTELARKVLDHIERHPEEHDQVTFAARKPVCGTTCCIAGHTLLLSGQYTLDIRNLEFRDESGREVTDEDNVAQDLLEISDIDAVNVFYTYNAEKAIARFRELILQAEKEQALNEA